VESVSLNGTAIANSAKSLLSNGPADIAFIKPFAQTVGSGPDSLVLKVSQDAWQGSAQYTVSVDGKQIGGTLTAYAAHSSPVDDLITVRGDFTGGTHKLTVNFLNDAWGGTTATDRNLYVDGIAYNGAEVANSVKAMLHGGPADFLFVA
jgi:hypothetical protein